jgi:hypothetical protein
MGGRETAALDQGLLQKHVCGSVSVSVSASAVLVEPNLCCPVFFQLRCITLDIANQGFKACNTWGWVLARGRSMIRDVAVFSTLEGSKFTASSACGVNLFLLALQLAREL